MLNFCSGPDCGFIWADRKWLQEFFLFVLESNAAVPSPFLEGALIKLPELFGDCLFSFAD